MNRTNYELFERSQVRPLSVSQVNQRARQLLERSFARVTVIGEISNAKSVSGHCYFSLKDEKAQLPAVLFRREASCLPFRLRDGLEVVATGRLTIYPSYGRYQMVLERIELRGAGALQAAYDELKARLAAEGLFSESRKRALPRLPRRVAVVTSPTGAVIRDIVNVATRRFPGAKLLVVPTRVQGAESAPDIAEAISRASDASSRMQVDVIIVARGGGSLEDLWGFNHEAVARAIAAARVPVVSGVGHETDVTISDFVADRRAPTPSAAAELVFPLRRDLVLMLRESINRAARSIERDVRHERQRLRAARAELGDGRGAVMVQMQRLDYAHSSLGAAMQRYMSKRAVQLAELQTGLAGLHPRARLSELRGELRGLDGRIRLLFEQRLARSRDRLEGAARHLDALSPLGVLDRGYSIALDASGNAVRDSNQMRPGDPVHVRVSRGAFDARVERVCVDSEETGE